MIVIYSKPNCKYCVAAKNLLTKKEVEYQELKIGEDISRDEFLELFPTAKTVPVITVDEEWIGGFKELNEYVEKKYA
jgi:glutaredoxin 3